MASVPASPPVGLYASHQPPHFCRGTSVVLPRFIRIPAEPVPFLPLFFFSFLSLQIWVYALRRLPVQSVGLSRRPSGSQALS